MCSSLSRQQIDKDLYLVLRSIFHYERIIATQYGLDFAEIYALQVLRRNPAVRVSDLAEELSLPMFKTSRLVNHLELAGFLRKQKDTADRRNTYLHISDAGERVIEQIEAGSYARISANLAKLDEKQVNELLQLAENLHFVLGVTDNVIK